MSREDRLKESEIFSEINNSSDDEDTSECEKAENKNISFKKKASSRKEGLENKRTFEIVSNTESYKTGKQKETHQKREEVKETSLKHVNLMKKTIKTHKQSDTISYCFKRKYNKTGSTRNDVDCKTKDNIVSKIFKSQLKKSQAVKSNQIQSLQATRVNSCQLSVPDSHNKNVQKVCVSNKVREHINKYSPSRVSKTNQSNYRILSDEKRCSVRELSSKYSSNNVPVCYVSKIPTVTEEADNIVRDKETTKSVKLYPEDNLNISDNNKHKISLMNFKHKNSLSSSSDDENETREGIWKLLNPSFKRQTENNDKVKMSNFGETSVMFKEKVNLDRNYECNEVNTASNLLPYDSAVRSLSPKSANSNNRYMNNHEVAKSQHCSRFLTSSSSSDSENDPTQKPLMNSKSNARKSRHLNEHDLSRNPSHSRFPRSSSSSNCEKDPFQKSLVPTNCNAYDRYEIENQKIKSNCLEALTDFSGGISRESNIASEITCLKQELPQSNYVEEECESSENKCVPNEVTINFPRKCCRLHTCNARSLCDSSVTPTRQQTYFAYSSPDEEVEQNIKFYESMQTSLSNQTNVCGDYVVCSSSDNKMKFSKVLQVDSPFLNIVNSTDTQRFFSTNNCFQGRSTRKRKAQKDDSEATSPKMRCDSLQSNSDVVTQTYFTSKGTEDSSLPDDLYHPRHIRSPQKNSAKKNLFSPTINMNEVSVSLADCNTSTKKKKGDQNDKENRAKSSSKNKNDSTPQNTSLCKENLSFEEDTETDSAVKHKLTPLKPAQTPTKQINMGSSSKCERASKTPRKNIGDVYSKGLEESQISNELSPIKKHGHSTCRSSEKEEKSSIAERELKRLHIDCKPSFYEAPSPVRKSRTNIPKAATPQKHKDAVESPVKTPQKSSTKKYIEKLNEQDEVYTPCKPFENGSKSLLCVKGTPGSPAVKSDKYKPNMMSPLVRQGVTVTTPVSKKKSGRGFITPSMARKEHSNKEKSDDDLDTTRKQLHISTVPTSLPCRGVEFDQIKSFLLRKIEHSAGGCMYISGVPGTGKTATVHAVIRSLQQEADNGDLPEFDFVEVNGLRLTEPKQAYVRILQTLTDRKLSPDQAQQLLNKRFSGDCKKSTIVLVDELDYLCNRRQDVIYNILDWPTKRGSALVVLTISNTMDLPERTLKGRVTSRMGLTRVTFQPYSYHQLKTIVENRLSGTDTFHPDAVQLVARKVAAVSGDARRALDICRRTTELVTKGEQVTVSHVEHALTQIFSGPRVAVIQSLCREGQLLLRAIRDVNQRTGVEEAIATQVYQHLLEICLVEGCPRPSVGDMLHTCVTLVALGLIVAEKGRMDIMRKISLNVSSDDIHYALDKVHV